MDLVHLANALIEDFAGAAVGIGGGYIVATHFGLHPLIMWLVIGAVCGGVLHKIIEHYNEEQIRHQALHPPKPSQSPQLPFDFPTATPPGPPEQHRDRAE